jgi:hypothetical protein
MNIGDLKSLYAADGVSAFESACKKIGAPLWVLPWL